MKLVLVKKHSKKEIREVASTAIHGLVARLELPLSGKLRRVAKEVSKMLAREIVEEQKRQLKKEALRSFIASREQD